MPQFRYRALDSSGREVDGVLDARDANTAVQQLSAKGFKLRSIEEGVKVVHRPKPTSQPARPRPVQKPRIEAPKAMTGDISLNSLKNPSRPANVPQHRTKRSTDAELFFLFSQLSNLLKSGISPAHSAATLSQRNHNSKLDGPMQHIAGMTAEGTAMSTAMSHYPDLFPKGVVGGVRAGEQGGYLPEACEVISKQRDEAVKLRNMFRWVIMIAGGSVFGLAFVIMAAKGIESGIDGINAGSSEAGNEVWRGMLRSFFGPVGITLGLLVLAYFVLRAKWMKTDNTLKRHAMGIKVPIFGHRARNECLSHFSWNLNRLAKAGLSPFSSWQVAADAVPNVAFAENLRKAGKGMSENTKFSELFYQSSLFPHEVAVTIETGEMSGSIEGALDQAMHVARDRQKQTDMLLKFKAGCWVALLIFAGTGLGIAIFYNIYFNSVFSILDE